MLDALLGLSWEAVARWMADSGLRILGVVAAVLAANALLRRLLPPLVTRAVLREAAPPQAIDLRKRADTLASVLVRTAQVVMLAIGSLLVLSELGYAIAPLLTGLGIGGVALGLGAQSLVRDMINGVFILVENQFGRGDFVSIAGVQGWVEDINLRRTLVRDLDGTLYSIPNSEIKVAGNLTRGFSGVNLLVPLVHTGDIEQAVALIDQAGQELAADPRLGPLILEPPRAVRVEGLTDKAVLLRVLGKTVPGAQFEVADALRRRIKRAFDAAGLRFGEGGPAPAAASTPPRP